ncbi:MAG TPA: phosphoribosylformylglycinamidine synthase subunit PurS [Actinomycetota bacterium]|nr:phosphoribosylformylglycinamidine synthase subunit PurS [Actinomycetota bacterium]
MARIDVMLKPGISDVQGQVVERSLPAMGWENVSDVRVGKHLELIVEGPSLDGLRAQVEKMCEAFLANTVIESYSVSLEQI